MLHGKNRRLANTKTKDETGFSFVLQLLNIQTPYGKKELKEMKPFYPGEEEALKSNLDDLETMVEFCRGKGKELDHLQEVFMMMKETSYTIERSADNVLSVVEIYEIKTLLLQMRTIGKLCFGEEFSLPEIYRLTDTEELLNVLDPRHDRLNTFYLYDSFSEKLMLLRKEKKSLEVELRRMLKAKKEELKKKFGISLTPKFDIVISKSHDDYQKALSTDMLQIISEDYVTATFKLKQDVEADRVTSEIEAINERIEDEETVVREMLSKEIGKYKGVLLENCKIIGRLDLAISKAVFAIKANCTKPRITNEHRVFFKEGRHIQVEEILKSKGKNYTPVSLSLKDGVTCITGANMGGKTISLKLSGLIPLMAQYGLFVPCIEAEIGLSNYIRILIGDCQSMERGLSSFGSEMEELKDILDTAEDRSLILIDEIANGTNPVEGLALTKSLIDYLKPKRYITLITTHFETVTWDEEIKNLQVRGLADADFNKLDSQLRYANRRERINIIGQYMDYRLMEVDEKTGVPKDALNIAKMLGISKEIIDGAKKYIK